MRYAVARLMAQSRGGGGESGFHAGEAAVQGRPEQPPQPSTLFAKTQCAKRSHPKTILRLSSDATARAQCVFPDGRTVGAVMAAFHLSTGGECLGVWVFECLSRLAGRQRDVARAPTPLLQGRGGLATSLLRGIPPNPAIRAENKTRRVERGARFRVNFPDRPL